jgi:hypothetical protein
MRKQEIDPKIKNALDELQNVGRRDPAAAARGRAAFLKQVAVSRQANQRHTRWYDNIFPLFQRKERFPMLNTVLAVVFAVAVFFGGTGGVVYAAQGSLPNQALYPVKTWSEDAVLSLTGSAQTRLNYVLDFSDRRVTEMAALLAAGKPIPDGVENRLQNELDMALQLASGMNDSLAIQQMNQIRQRAEDQLQTLITLMSGNPGSAEQTLTMAHARLQEQIQLAAMGETDMPGFRMQVQQRFQNQGDSGEPTPGTGNNPKGPGSMNPSEMPGPSATGSGNGSMSPTTMPGPGMNQPTGTPGQYGPGSMMPDRTPQPGGGSGHMP